MSEDLSFYRQRKSKPSPPKPEFIDEDPVSPPCEFDVDSQLSAFQASERGEYDDVYRIIQACSDSSSVQPQALSALQSWAGNEAFKCKRCNKTIHASEKRICQGSLHFHPQHFTCCKCKTPLTKQNTAEVDGDVYCLNCTLLREPKLEVTEAVCQLCGATKTESIVFINGKWFCETHLKCCVCDCGLDDGNLKQHNRKLYCKKHVPERVVVFCEKCKAEVRDRSIKALGKVFHPACFICTMCKRGLANQPYTAWQSQPICQDCFLKLPMNVRRAITRSVQNRC